MPKQYVATIRAQYLADDDAEAMLIADDIKEKGGAELEFEEGDEIEVMQVIDTAPADTPAEVINVLAKARDTLISMRRMSEIELAREIDKYIYKLENHDEDGMMTYDYGRFMELMRAIITPKEPS